MQRTTRQGKERHCKHCGCGYKTAERWVIAGSRSMLIWNLCEDSTVLCGECDRADKVLLGIRQVCLRFSPLAHLVP